MNSGKKTAVTLDNHFLDLFTGKKQWMTGALLCDS